MFSMRMLTVSLGYALSRLVVLTRWAFLKPCGGAKVLGSTCFDRSGPERCGSANARLDSAAMALVTRENDLMLGSSQVTQSCEVSVERARSRSGAATKRGGCVC